MRDRGSQAGGRLSKHTGGPWRVYEGINFVLVVPPTYPISNGFLGGAICELDDWDEVEGRHHQDQPHILENARLIAAAPDLLAACHLALKLPRPWMDGEITQEEWTEAFDKIQAAISKATSSGAAKQEDECRKSQLQP